VNPNQANQYEASNPFTFVPDDVDGVETETFTFVATGSGGESEGEGSVEVTVTDSAPFECAGAAEVEVQC
jgi:hypothetical protein